MFAFPKKKINKSNGLSSRKKRVKRKQERKTEATEVKCVSAPVCLVSQHKAQEIIMYKIVR